MATTERTGVLVLEGGPAERGPQHGKALRPAVPAATVTMDVALGPPDEAPWLELELAR